jgi:uncharacterized ion transporter superfamily protein YfcC
MSDADMTTGDGKPVRRFRAPDTFVILFCVALLAWAARWLVPAGRFKTDGTGSFSLSSFEAVGRTPVPFFSGDDSTIGFLDFLFEGLIAGDRYSATIGLMAFLLIVGGAFGIILRTGAMEAALKRLIDRSGGTGSQRTDIMVAGLFFAFSLAGAVFGMGEEAIVFVLILAPGLIRAGYDSLTVLLVTYVATQVGFATSWMNPFSVVVAQGIAGLDVMSGAALRMIMWACFTTLGASLTYRYASAIRRAPGSSRTAPTDRLHLTDADTEMTSDFGVGHSLILLIVLGGIGWVAWGVAVHQYYFAQIAAQFFAMGLAAALVAKIFKLGGMGFNECGEAFRDGAVQLAPAALIIGFAKGVVVLLGGDAPGDPSVLNTLLFGMGNATQDLPAALAASGMLLLQAVTNIFVVSGSGQAALTMPLMAPLSDLIGVERQIAVLAFQLGDGLMNLIVPSSAALMGSLAAARVSWGTWIGFIWKSVLFAFALGLVFILIAVAIGYA